MVTPLELLSHLQEEGIALADLQPAPPSYGIPAIDPFVHRASPAGIFYGCAESSGGLAKHVPLLPPVHLCNTVHRHAFEHVALHKFGRAVAADFVKVKNSDHREATLVVDGQVVLRACLTYGFRNIQNLVRAARAAKRLPHSRARACVTPTAARRSAPSRARNPSRTSSRSPLPYTPHRLFVSRASGHGLPQRLHQRRRAAPPPGRRRPP